MDISTYMKIFSISIVYIYIYTHNRQYYIYIFYEYIYALHRHFVTRFGICKTQHFVCFVPMCCPCAAHVLQSLRCLLLFFAPNSKENVGKLVPVLGFTVLFGGVFGDDGTGVSSFTS